MGSHRRMLAPADPDVFAAIAGIGVQLLSESPFPLLSVLPVSSAPSPSPLARQP